MSTGRRVLIAIASVLVAIALALGLTIWRVFPISRAPVTMVYYQSTGFGSCDMFPIYEINVTALTITTTSSCTDDTETSRAVDSADMARFATALDASGFRHWRSTYANRTITDGGGFDLQVTFADGKTQSVTTLNRNPPGVQGLYDALAVIGITR